MTRERLIEIYESVLRQAFDDLGDDFDLCREDIDFTDAGAVICGEAEMLPQGTIAPWFQRDRQLPHQREAGLGRSHASGDPGAFLGDQDGWDTRTERVRAGCFATEPATVWVVPVREMVVS